LFNSSDQDSGFKGTILHSEVLRAFVALEVPGHVLDALVDFQRSLSRTGADLKVVERENLHFTIKFLGEITDAAVAEAQSRLGKTSIPGAEIEVRGTGAFPKAANPRVVWAGAAPKDEERVSSIAHEVVHSLEGIGERDDRPFRAHITLARVRSPRNSRLLGELLLNEADRPFGVAKLGHLKLKSSVLTASGPIYEDIGVFPLL
jgi:RNA 2',3'-cyclic 3'-phosphodiesterase